MKVLVLFAIVSGWAGAGGAAQDAPPLRPAQRDEWQYLTSHFNIQGFAGAPPEQNAGFDGNGNSFDASRLKGDSLTVRSVRYGRVDFICPPLGKDENDMVACDGQVIKIRTKKLFNVVFFLGSAHNGDHFGWVELEFEDGSKATGPFGFSDWGFAPVLGEETAFEIPTLGPLSQQAPRISRLFLQRTPIPEARKLVSIRLPANLPRAKILGLTLGWREGVTLPATPPRAPPEAGLVAIFGEPLFPHTSVRGDLGPGRIRDAFVEKGIPAAVLDLQNLEDPKVLDAKAYAVLINPYGNNFPSAAAESIRAYRKSGGAMVHLSVPFTHPSMRSPYGNWIDQGHRMDFTTHDAPLGMGIGDYADATATELVAHEPLTSWGLKDVRWDRFLPRGDDLAPHVGFFPQVLRQKSLDSTDEVVPLLSLKNVNDGPFAAVVRHKSCAFAGATDVWLGHLCVGLEPLDAPVALAVEAIVRASAFVLREKGLIDEGKWKEVASPIPENLREPERLEPVLPDADWGWRLPGGIATRKRVVHARVDELADSEKVLLASAQGLVNRSEGDSSVFLVDGAASERRLAAWKDAGLLEELVKVEPREIIAGVGHKKAVVVDPEVPGSLHLAIMIASVEGLLVAYPADVERYDLEAAGDLRGAFSSSVEGYEWAFQNIWPHLSHRALAFVEPDPRAWKLVDYLLARKIFSFWMHGERSSTLSGQVPAEEQDFACRLLARSAVAIPVLGSAASARLPESSITLLSRFGKYHVPVLGLSNLSFSAGLEPRFKRPEPPKVEPPKLERDKVYIAWMPPELLSGDLFNVRAFEEIEEHLAPRTQGPRFAGRILPTSLGQLLPAQAAGAGQVQDRECLGSAGLGEMIPDSFGSAFGEGSGRVRQAYWELTEASMLEMGQTFLLLPRWRAPGGVGISESAAALSSAQAIFPNLPFQGQAGIRAMDAAYMVRGKPVIHGLGLNELSSGSSSADPAARPYTVFVWSPLADPSENTTIAEGTVLVSPLELAALFKEYQEKYAPQKLDLVAAGSVWRYDDKGAYPGDAWKSLDLDDSKWSAGPAELGYGEAGEGRPEATVISGGPDSKNKHMAAYFRRAFETADPLELKALLLEMMVDDGCVVYFNGQEVARSNMPEGAVEFATKASKALGGSSEHQWVAFDVKPTSLRKGKNVVAVEVHQSGASSTDLGFDLRLTALKERPAPQEERQAPSR
jgi:hypothetical protein